MTVQWKPNKENVEDCLFGVETATMCDELVHKEKARRKVQVARFAEVVHPHKKDYRPKDKSTAWDVLRLWVIVIGGSYAFYSLLRLVVVYAERIDRLGR